ncbi:MAG: DUF6056 family protein [Solobacterium sp.]|jgi:hypothetical protein|nr:DUF6056 family protein [Solobacterium sp.]
MKHTLKLNREQIMHIIVALLIFCFFYYICRLIPLTGDDWDYANKAAEFGVIGKASEMYMTWSGRFVSDAWTLFMSLHKGVWNVANAAIFAGIYLLMVHLAGARKNKIAVTLVCLALMLGINRDIRIEAYLWINGAHFTLPLFLMLSYFSLVKGHLNNRSNRWLTAGMIIIGFLSCLCSENATVILVVGSVLIYLYCLKQKQKMHWAFLLITIIPAMIMFLSPGMEERLATENAAWNSYSFFTKIGLNWSSMISYTFARNSVLMIFLGLILLAGVLTVKKRTGHYSRLNIFMLVMNVLCVIFAAAQELYSRGYLSGLASVLDYSNSTPAMIIISVFFVLFVISVFMEVWALFDSEHRFIPMLVLILACVGNAAMMLSPSFQARSSLYTVYLLSLLSLMIIGSFDLPKWQPALLSVMGAVITVAVAVNWTGIYKEVNRIQQLRMEQITYYQGHWDETEIYMPRFPAYYIHGGDIETEDTFHKQAFLQYYNLNPDANLYFYKLPEYIDD